MLILQKQNGANKQKSRQIATRSTQELCVREKEIAIAGSMRNSR